MQQMPFFLRSNIHNYFGLYRVLNLFPLYSRINVVHYGTMGVHTVETQRITPSSGRPREKKT